MRSLLLIIALIGLSTLNAQTYGSSLGLRLGNGADYRTLGLTGQYRVARFVTLEGIVQSDFRRNTTFHLLVERHRRIFTRRLNAYVGAGISAGWEESTEFDEVERAIVTTWGNETVGVDFVAGLEITIIGTNISLDYKPNINLQGREAWYVGQVGISVRQVLTTGREQSKRQRKRAKAKKKRAKERQKVEDRKDEEPWLKDWWDRTFR